MTKSALFLRLGLSCAAVSLAAACSLTPPMEAQKAPDMAAYKEAGSWIKAAPADDQLGRDWWKAFKNPELDALEEKAGKNNQDLKLALARLDEARAEVDVAAAGLLPSVTLNAVPERVRNSKTTNKAAGTGNDFLLAGAASFETDLWGRVRNQVAANKALAEASADDLATAELSIRAEVARDYFTLRGYDETQKLLDETVKSYEKALELTQNRHAGGIATEADVSQAETQLDNAKTQAADTHMKRQQTEHAIAVLTGAVPAGFSLPDQPVESTLPHPDPGLPASLLQRRPDVASAERQMIAANDEIGVARAAYYPDLVLTGEGGFESNALKTLIEAPSLLWAFGASVTMPLFDGGRIDALTRVAHAQYDETLAQYRQTVLSAYQEVEDSLIALHQLDIESGTQEAATEAAEKTLAQAKDRYAGGIANYLDVVVAENTALDAEMQNINIHTARLTASLALIQALGGASPEAAPAPAQNNAAPAPDAAAKP